MRVPAPVSQIISEIPTRVADPNVYIIQIAHQLKRALRTNAKTPVPERVPNTPIAVL